MQTKALWKLPVPSNKSEIRRWGCNRTETPLIFVHIGKAGGGSVRARIAASSLNYTRKRLKETDDSYYPVSVTEKARYVSSCYSNWLLSYEKTFEGTRPCHASTPIGRAIACPETTTHLYRQCRQQRHGECDPFSATCHLVYAGHNFFGSEMHWLPVPYLNQWWISLSDQDNAVTPLWDKLLPNNSWCSSKNQSRPMGHRIDLQEYDECSVPLQREVDFKAIQTLTGQMSHDKSQAITSWSPLYASLPVLRVTIIRDPFSWLLSKYFWHRSKEDIKNNSTCDNIAEALSTGNKNGLPRPNELDMDNSGPGWISRMSLGYIVYLCGEDCFVRYAAGTATLADLEQQAESNLRQAFAVVGILEEIDTFYEMVTSRVQYMDMSLSAETKGGRHSAGPTDHCKERFQDPNFQAKLLERSPELRVLSRLHLVAKEVNKFQLQELRSCSLANAA